MGTKKLAVLDPNTLRKWADEGKIKHIKTDAGQRRYDVASFLQSSTHRRKIVYARVPCRNKTSQVPDRERYSKSQSIDDDRRESHAVRLRRSRTNRATRTRPLCAILQVAAPPRPLVSVRMNSSNTWPTNTTAASWSQRHFAQSSRRPKGVSRSQAELTQASPPFLPTCAFGERTWPKR